MNYYRLDWPKTIASCLMIVLIFSIILGAIEGFVFMFLWNWISPIFCISIPQLTFLQAWGVIQAFGVIWIWNLFTSQSK